MMTKNGTKYPASILIVSVLISSLLTHHSFAQPLPNIIYIMADDLGYADLSSYGRKDYSTPHLDILASQGMKFTNAYAAAPLCTPTRVAFMTGRYPARLTIGLKEPIVMNAKDSATGLGPDRPTLALLLKKAGYETALIGKWHLGFQPPYSPNSNGFDYFFGIHSGGVDYINYRGEKGGHDLYENTKPCDTSGYLTELLRDKAKEFLRRNHIKPFFLSLQFNAPHWPWQAPGDAAYPDTMRLTNGGSPDIFARMMKSLDEAIGEILTTLEEQKLSNNTIIIFTSDNGGERFSDMGPLSGRKATLWEGGIRVPAFVRWPGKIKPGQSDQPVITFDWTATILDIAKTNQPAEAPPDGTSLLPLLTSNQILPERDFYWRVFQRNNQKAVRSGNWKYLKDEKGEYLFDLSKDIGEKNNLKKRNRKKFKQLRNKMETWESSVLKPIPLGS